MAPRKMKRAASLEELTKVDQDKPEENANLAPKRGRGKTTKNLPKSDVIDENIEVQSEPEDTEEVNTVVKGRGKKKETISKSNGTTKADAPKGKRGQQVAKSNDADTDEDKEDELPKLPIKRSRNARSAKESEDEVGDVKAPKGKRGQAAKPSGKDELETLLEGDEKSKTPKSKKGRGAKLAIEDEEENADGVDIEGEDVPEEEDEVEPARGKRTQGKKPALGKGNRRKKNAPEEPEEEEDVPAEKKAGAKPKRGKVAPAKPKRGKAASKESDYVDIDGKELRVSIEH